jgi:mono/diheme cytochrome c family protein
MGRRTVESSSWHFVSRAAALFGVSAALLLAGGGLGCGSAQPPAESAEQTTQKPAEGPTATPGEAAAAPAIVAPATPFEDMKHGDQIAYMKNVVLPAMAKSFQAVEPEEFANMNCATCHGPGAKNGSFEMPNPDLPKLDVTDGFAVHMKEHPEMTKFMMEKVVPDVATLLGEEPYNPETGKGFGCFDCHMKQ